MKKDFNLEKLEVFQGSVLKELKIPDTYKSYAATCRKVIKLYNRLHSDQLFYPELVSSVQSLASALRYVGISTFSDKAPDNLLDYLEDISTAKLDRYVEFKKALNMNQTLEVVVEESRERIEGKRCSICRVCLHFPSYIVHRNEVEVLHRSAAIGVKCLRSSIGKVNKLLNSPQIISVLNEMKQNLVEV